MTAAELAQAFRDAGDYMVAAAMECVFGMLGLRGIERELAALAIAEARIREMWRERGCEGFERMDGRHGALSDCRMQGWWPDTGWRLLGDGDNLADCLNAALLAALEAPDGE